MYVPGWGPHVCRVCVRGAAILLASELAGELTIPDLRLGASRCTNTTTRVQSTLYVCCLTRYQLNVTFTIQTIAVDAM